MYLEDEAPGALPGNKVDGGADAAFDDVADVKGTIDVGAVVVRPLNPWAEDFN